MERIREAIKIAKRTRDISGNPSVLAPRTVMHPEAALNAPQGTIAAVDAKTNLRMIQTNKAHLQEKRIVGHLSDGVGTIPFDILRTKVIQEMNAQNWSILVVTSPTPGCGKTVTSINLALSMAKLQSHSIYLVDMDLRKPNVANYLGVPKVPFLNDYLYGQVSAEETLFSLDIAGKNLAIACNRDAIQNPAEAMASRSVADFFAFLKSRQDRCVIIVDLPPLLISDDVMSVLPLADCCILTVAENMSTRQDVENSSELLRATNFLGCVYNKSLEINKNYNYY